MTSRARINAAGVQRIERKAIGQSNVVIDGVAPRSTEMRPPLISEVNPSFQRKRYKFASSPSCTTTRSDLSPHLPPHLLHREGSDANTSNPAPRGISPRRGNPTISDSRAASSNVKGKKVNDAQNGAGEVTSHQHSPISHEVAVAKLRLYLAARMLQAVRCSPNGGFGIPVDCVIQEMAKDFGEDLVKALFRDGSQNALIMNECGDIVELMPLRVQQLTKNGCVPSVQFRRDSTNMEARIRRECLAIISRAEAEEKRAPKASRQRRKENTTDSANTPVPIENIATPPALQEASVSIRAQEEAVLEKDLFENVKKVVEDMMKEVLTKATPFPTLAQFIENFKKEYGRELDPKDVGYENVLDLLQSIKLDSLIRFVHTNGKCFIVPANQEFNKHYTPPERTDETQMERCSEKEDTAIPSFPQILNNDQALPLPLQLAGENSLALTDTMVTHPVSKKGEMLYIQNETGSGMLCTSGHLSIQTDISGDEDDEFDIEILHKLRTLFEQTVCKTHKPILLNRLPLVFLRRCGCVLDYQKYGFINLMDVVSLLNDVVKVVDSEKGKIIVSSERPRKPIGTPLTMALRDENAQKLSGFPSKTRDGLISTGIQTKELPSDRSGEIAARSIPQGVLPSNLFSVYQALSQIPVPFQSPPAFPQPEGTVDANWGVRK